MPETPRPNRRTPAWLWALFAVGLAVLATGSFLARVDGQLFGIPVLVVGLAVVVTFVALRARSTGKR
jgi:NADH:ubiquinone oxidoreductase subunit K